jgi:hypothetical protein
MKVYISASEIFIMHGERSAEAYQPTIGKHIEMTFGPGRFTDDAIVRKILEEYYDYCSKLFVNIIAGIDDWLFVTYLFSFHEASVLLWQRSLANENLQEKFGISEEDLSLNRRIFKLALEQTCDNNYTKNNRATPEQLQEYDETIEDLLYIGSQMYQAAQFLAEMRMIQGYIEVSIEGGGLVKITRQSHIETIFQSLFSKMKQDFEKGIVDKDGVKELIGEIKNCFGIDYNFAAGQIAHIKKSHSASTWKLQTIEPGILEQNLVTNGASKVDAENFYTGLILSEKNKLAVKDAVYKVNSMERYLFRPILEISQNGKKRHLIGVEKWSESIVILATNNFQWNKAPEEWRRNKCFQSYLEKKSNEHDALLENEVEEILNQNHIPFFRNIKSFGNGKEAKSINVAGVGEIDFIWLDTRRKRIVVADCKYNRARYDAMSFSADFTNFKDSYEKKISGKSKWVNENRDLVYNHFLRHNPGLSIDIDQYTIEELFIINTPTLYMYLNRVNTVCFFNLEEFILNNYTHPSITVSFKIGNRTTILVKEYPYLQN